MKVLLTALFSSTFLLATPALAASDNISANTAPLRMTLERSDANGSVNVRAMMTEIMLQDDGPDYDVCVSECQIEQHTEEGNCNLYYGHLHDMSPRNDCIDASEANEKACEATCYRNTQPLEPTT